MCGICGIVTPDASERIDDELLERMNSSLAHRGPDDSGYYRGPGAGLGHRRLSIIDLGGGKQPIFNEDGSAVIVFNGEIYNYLELTAHLVSRGHTFKTRSDTEAIVHAYEEYGDDCVQRLRGMFAFAIWDCRRRRLLIARDRLGKKPLYFSRGQGWFAFASEIKALLHIPQLRREVDEEALDLYLSLRYVPGPRTMFKNIWKLQPGHLLSLDSSGIHIRRYWDVRPRPEEKLSSEHALERFEELLEESVRLRLMSEVPLGVFLSGGVDSSAILAMMKKVRGGETIRTFSVGYEAATAGEEESNEFTYARQAAQAFDAEHHEFRLTPSDFRDTIPRLVWHLDEPLADPSCIPLYFISRLAREQVTVVLSGEGADEILAGYGIYRRMLALEGLHTRVPALAWLAPHLARVTPGALVRNYVMMAGLPLETRYRGVSRGIAPGLKARLLPGSDNSLLDGVFASHAKAAGPANALDRMLYLDLKIWLPDDLLMKADKMTMATGLELRVPFLDQELVEFAFTLPADLKIRSGIGKHLLRRAMRGVLPDSILDRPKKGFPVPTEFWLRRQMREFTRDVLLSTDSACRSFMDSAALKEVVEGGRHHQDIWTLLVFEFWHRQFIEPVSGLAAQLSGGPLTAET